MRSLRLALAQTNSTVGDLAGNYKKIVDYINRAIEMEADIVAFPELAICGYPPEDLLLRPEFIDDNLQYLNKLLPLSEKISIVVGFVDRKDDIFNAAAILHQGSLEGVYHKQFLPNYSVFDENRYFQEGKSNPVFLYNGINIGVNICEDIWYPGGPLHYQALYGDAEVIINLSASPYAMEKIADREEMLSVRARDNDVILAYCNLVGGQDDLVFDGSSVILSENGEPISRAPAFEEALICADLHPDQVFSKRLHDPRRRKEKRFDPPEDKLVWKVALMPVEEKQKKPLPDTEPHLPMVRHNEIYAALTTGLRDYVHKNGFSKIALGLSGGIDSALVAAVAADALGPENVMAISMPSKFTSDDSKTDAEQLAENFGINFSEIAIGDLYNTYIDALKPLFGDREADLTEENLQARIRGTLLMGYSNKFGALILTTGNKSEYSTGYCTLYGDMVGAVAVIKDVPKLLVYELCRHRNNVAGFDIIPRNILTKEPSAELRPDQKDTDSLPPYEVLDPIIEAYVERDLGFDEIVSMGYDRDTVQRVIRLTDINEYKRRQSAPGIKITARAFGKDRRFPITNRYKPGTEID